MLRIKLNPPLPQELPDIFRVYDFRGIFLGTIKWRRFAFPDGSCEYRYGFIWSTENVAGAGANTLQEIVDAIRQANALRGVQ